MVYQGVDVGCRFAGLEQFQHFQGLLLLDAKFDGLVLFVLQCFRLGLHEVRLLLLHLALPLPGFRFELHLDEPPAFQPFEVFSHVHLEGGLCLHGLVLLEVFKEFSLVLARELLEIGPLTLQAECELKLRTLLRAHQRRAFKVAFRRPDLDDFRRLLLRHSDGVKLSGFEQLDDILAYFALGKSVVFGEDNLPDLRWVRQAC